MASFERDLLFKQKYPTAFMLWGAYAQKNMRNFHAQIDPERHLILTSAHPSLLSVTGFLECRHFSQVNAF